MFAKNQLFEIRLLLTRLLPSWRTQFAFILFVAASSPLHLLFNKLLQCKLQQVLGITSGQVV